MPLTTYLNTLMTKHVMRTAVNTQTNITIFFRVGRCVNIDDIRDSVVVFVPLDTYSAWMDVELSCVAGEDTVCGSQITSQATATINVKTK